MDVSFMENQPYFTKNHLQGKNNVEEDNFLKIFESLPNMIDIIDTPLHFDRQSKEIGAQNNKEQDVSSLQVLSIMESKLGGELLQTDQSNPKPKLQFYIRRKCQIKVIDPNVPPVTEQLTSSNDDPSST